MIRNRSMRVLATIGVTAALLAAMAGPTVISAAPAPLDIGFGPTVGVDPASNTGALPVEVQPGAHAAFEVWAQNNGNSNISKLFLTALTTGTFEEVTVVNSEGLSGTCGDGPMAGVELACEWSQVTPGATIQIRVVFDTPSTGTEMGVKFEWSTSGFVLNTKGKNKSHGDAFEQSDKVGLNSNANLFAGGYLVDGDSTDVGTNPSLNRQNPQSTTVHAPAVDIPVTAAEENEIGQCQALFTTCFGQASVINVGGGTDYTALGGFTVDIVFNVNKPGADVLHIFDDGSIDAAFVECGEVPIVPCYQVNTANGKTFVHAFLNENGKIFGH